MDKIGRRLMSAGMKAFSAVLICALYIPACANHNAAATSVDAPIPTENFDPPSGNPVLDQIALSYSADQFVEETVPPCDIETILRSGAKTRRSGILPS